jgi:Putative zinc-finger
MPEHEYFRKLTSVAALGELSPAEAAELTSHLHECASCQSTYMEFLELADNHLPLADRRTERSKVTGSHGIRKVVLRRAAEQGLRITPEAARGVVGWRKRAANRIEDFRWGIVARRGYLGMSAALLVAGIATTLAMRYDVARKNEIEQLRSDLVRTRDDATKLRENLRTTEESDSRNSTETDDLEQRLADASAQVTRLNTQHQEDLAAIRLLEARVDEVKSYRKMLAQQSDSASSELATLRGQLDQSRAAAADKETRLLSAQFQITELSNQLKAQQTAVEREQELLSAGRDIRDLMGARNLHIIDVHDMDAHGESRPFGRIFLTEGKRLIFYAYDLDALRVKDASFQAWGQRENGNRTTVNLGLLYMDDQKQSRWALKVEDPNLLKAINSVFVTVEPNGGTVKPTGKKLMYAYLRNPINHP